MLKIIRKSIKNNDGQALVLVALMLVVLLGFGAISIDYGYLAWQKRSLQNAADAAALAAARELPFSGLVRQSAVKYAKENAPELQDENITYTISPSRNEVKVDVKFTYNTFLGMALGQKSKEISATATAEKFSEWAGEALPFLNLAFNYPDFTEEKFMAWTAQPSVSGNMGTIMNFYTRNDGTDYRYFDIDYDPGIQITNGFSNGQKGVDDSTLKNTLAYVMTSEDIGRKFYLFSLKPEVIAKGEVEIITGNKGEDKTIDIEDIKNKDIVIKEDQIVLIEVILRGFDISNQHNIRLTYTGNSYNLEDQFPTEHLNVEGYASRLID